MSTYPGYGYEFLKIPSDAWDTIEETLGMDMNSHALSPELREDIRSAVEKIEMLTTVWVVTHETPQEAFPIISVFFSPLRALEYCVLDIVKGWAEEVDEQELLALIEVGRLDEALEEWQRIQETGSSPEYLRIHEVKVE